MAAEEKFGNEELAMTISWKRTKDEQPEHSGMYHAMDFAVNAIYDAFYDKERGGWYIAKVRMAIPPDVWAQYARPDKIEDIRAKMKVRLDAEMSERETANNQRLDEYRKKCQRSLIAQLGISNDEFKVLFIPGKDGGWRFSWVKSAHELFDTKDGAIKLMLMPCPKCGGERAFFVDTWDMLRIIVAAEEQITCIQGCVDKKKRTTEVI